jgi:hypothetical protein
VKSGQAVGEDLDVTSVDSTEPQISAIAVRPAVSTEEHPGGGPWWRRRAVRIGVSYVVLVAAIAWLYGLVPFTGRTFPLAPIASVRSWVGCIEDGLVPCTYIGYPEGVDPSLGLSAFTGTYLLTRLGMDVEPALNLLAVLALATGIASLWAFTASIVRSTAVGALACCLYYLSPAMIAHTSKLGLWFGFVLLPLPLALTSAALRPGNRKTIALLCVVLTFAATLTIVYLDPYAWSIAMILAVFVCVVGAVMLVRRTGWRGVILPPLTLAALLAPGLIFRAIEPAAEYSQDFPLGFYRTYSVDVVTAVVPTQQSLIGDLLGSPVERWRIGDFYGDGTQLNGTFIGVATLIAAVAGAVVLLRGRRVGRPVVLGLALGGLACLVLGLGPSLKVLDKVSSPVAVVGADGQVTDTVHVMPASEATLSLPWSWIYGVQPFEGMRTAYRWHIGLRVVLAIFAAVAVVWLFRRSRALGLALAALVVLETGSHGLFDARQEAAHNHELVETFDADMDRAFGHGRLRRSERVLFLPAGNDYLIGAIAPERQLFTYNLAFDKEVARIRPRQPKPVVDAIFAYAWNTLTSEQVCGLFRQDLVDVVVFNDFNMRSDTLIWPPPHQSLGARRTHNAAFGVFDDPAFDVDEGHLSVTVRPRAGSRCDLPAAPP